MNHSRPQLSGHIPRPRRIARRHHPGQPIGGVVRDADCVGLVLVADEHHDRAADLLARDGHIVRHVRKDGGPEEVTGGQSCRATDPTSDECAALIDAGLDQALHLVELCL